MKKRNIVAFCVVLVLICNFLGVSQSGAWFVSGGSFSDNSYNTAQVVYLPALQDEIIYNEGIPKYGRLLSGTPESASAAQTVYLVPGDSMIDSGEKTVGTTKVTYPDILSLENFSTVPTNVQVRINVVFDNKSYDETGAEIEGSEDTTTDYTQFSWQRSGTSDTYEYGVSNADNQFMPLLRVTFAKALAASYTKLPQGYNYGANTTLPYSWVYESASAGWNLILDGNNTAIPQTAPDTQQFYNVITGFEIVANTTEKSLQTTFDTFFSEHYAGHKITINIKYYAKQIAEGAGWGLFDSQTIATQLHTSREQASF